MIVYLSYSGLGPDIERGIDHKALRANFPRLSEHGIPVIHYWRPLIHANAAPETITYVLDWAARYSTCSVAVGLKVKRGSRQQMADLWPALSDENLPLESADAVWPRETWDLLDTLPLRYPDHPIYQTNSCALAHVLQRPDNHHVHTTPTCTANHCPASQRERCATSSPPPVTTDAIRIQLVWLGVPTIPDLDWDATTRTVTIQGALSLRDRSNIAQRLGIAVRAPRGSNEQYWAGRLEGRQPLIVDG